MEPRCVSTLQSGIFNFTNASQLSNKQDVFQDSPITGLFKVSQERLALLAAPLPCGQITRQVSTQLKDGEYKESCTKISAVASKQPSISDGRLSSLNNDFSIHASKVDINESVMWMEFQNAGRSTDLRVMSYEEFLVLTRATVDQFTIEKMNIIKKNEIFFEAFMRKKKGLIGDTVEPTMKILMGWDDHSVGLRCQLMEHALDRDYSLFASMLLFVDNSPRDELCGDVKSNCGVSSVESKDARVKPTIQLPAPVKEIGLKLSVTLEQYKNCVWDEYQSSNPETKLDFALYGFSQFMDCYKKISMLPHDNQIKMKREYFGFIKALAKKVGANFFNPILRQLNRDMKNLINDPKESYEKKTKEKLKKKRKPETEAGSETSPKRAKTS